MQFNNEHVPLPILGGEGVPVYFNFPNRKHINGHCRQVNYNDRQICFRLIIKLLKLLCSLISFIEIQIYKIEKKC